MGAAVAKGVRLTASVAASTILSEEVGSTADCGAAIIGGAICVGAIAGAVTGGALVINEADVGANVGRRLPRGGGDVRAGRTGGGKLGIAC